MRAEEAETVALQALAWLAAEDDLLQVFLGSAGLGAGDLKARASDPEVLAAVLDFLVMDDTWVKAFAESLGRSPEDAMRARAALPGGALPHWT